MLNTVQYECLKHVSSGLMTVTHKEKSRIELGINSELTAELSLRNVFKGIFWAKMKA